MHAGVARQIALTDDTNDAVTVIHNWHPPNLMTGHLPHATKDRIIGMAGKGITSHRLLHPRPPRFYPACGDSHSNVAIGHHADEPPLTVHHGERSTIAFAHQPRRALNGIVRMNGNYVARHDLMCAQIFQVILGTRVSALTLTLLLPPLIQAPTTFSILIAEPRPDLVASAVEKAAVFAEPPQAASFIFSI
jgi:hypothetical protein